MATFVKSSSFSSSPSLQNLDELQNCLGHTIKNYRKNSLNCKWRYNYQMCRAAAVGLNSDADQCSLGSSTKRADENKSSSLFDCLMRQSSSGAASSRNLDDAAVCRTRKKRIDKEEDVSRKLDQWIKDSVVEILNSLDEAPFLVHIYSDGEEGSASMNKSRLVKEKAAADNWPHIKERWIGGSPTPNGIILVEEMERGEPAADSPAEENWKRADISNKQSSSTKVWGLLIQGKGANYPACYILKTSRVQCVSGFCTHFCLVRVECFAEHVDIQFKKSWLL